MVTAETSLASRRPGTSVALTRAVLTNTSFTPMLSALTLAFCLAFSPRANVEVPSTAHEKPFRVRFGPAAEPATLNPLTLDGQEALPIHAVTLESLLTPDDDTYAWRPLLAERWSEAADGSTIDFWLRPNAKWCDGRAVTAADVRFSFEAIFDPRFQLEFMRPFYATISSVEAIDQHHVRIHFNRKYFGNLIQIASLKILPRHVYGDPNHSARSNENLCGSGPYTVERWDHGRAVALKRNPHWWGRSDAHGKHFHRPRRMSFVFVDDDTRALEMMDRGELDFTELSPDAYTRHRRRGRAPSNYEIQEVINSAPTSVNQITLNLRDAKFRDPRVRQALNLLVNRAAMVEHLYAGAATSAVGPWYRQSPFADPGAAGFDFDPARALKLLKSAGWEDDGTSEVLSRVIDGRSVPMSFTVMAATNNDVRLLTMFKEDAARVGVRILIRRVDGNAIYRSLTSRTFEAVITTDRGRFVNFDPSSEFSSTGGANFAGLASAKADALIQRVLVSDSLEERQPSMRELFNEVRHQMPAIYLLNDRASYYAVSNRVGRPRPFTRFDNGRSRMYIHAESGR